MPIAFSCPHCGKATTVADQYAGQSGPCAACGQTITIPHALPPGGYRPAPSSAGGSGMMVAAIVGLLTVVMVVVACAGIGFFAFRGMSTGVTKARGAAQRAQSANNMKQILLAMHMYHDVYAQLPPAVVKDADGKPLYSGMVLLLPYLEQSHLHQQFDLSKPWDAPENRAISMIELQVFRNPSAPSGGQGQTDYMWVGGPQSLLGVDGKRTFADCTDGTSNTMVLVEVRGSSHSWAEPVVWTPDQPLDSDTVDVVNVGLADGSVHAFPRNMPQQQIQLIANPNDGTPVQVP